jgi:hypothetical protein
MKHQQQQSVVMCNWNWYSHGGTAGYSQVLHSSTQHTKCLSSRPTVAVYANVSVTAE